MAVLEVRNQVLATLAASLAYRLSPVNLCVCVGVSECVCVCTRVRDVSEWGGVRVRV